MMTIQQPNGRQHLPYTPFNNMYALDKDGLTTFLDEISTETVLENIRYLFESPLDSVVGIRCYPFNVRASGAVVPDSLPLGIATGKVTLDSKGYVISQTITPIAYEIENVPLLHNSFLDYEPYTSLQLYLPYIGFVNLEPRRVMGRSLTVSYIVDMFTGNATAYVQSPNDDDELECIMICEGKIAIDIPVTARNAVETSRNTLMTGLGAGAGVASAKVNAAMSIAASQGASTVPAVMGLATSEINSTISMVSAMREHISKGVQGDGYNAWYAPQEPHIIITRTDAKYPVDYNHHYGRPSAKTAQLSTLEGFTKVAAVHVEGLGTATQDEVAEVERLLRVGVIL